MYGFDTVLPSLADVDLIVESCPLDAVLYAAWQVLPLGSRLSTTFLSVSVDPVSSSLLARESSVSFRLLTSRAVAPEVRRGDSLSPARDLRSASFTEAFASMVAAMSWL